MYLVKVVPEEAKNDGHFGIFWEGGSRLVIEQIIFYWGTCFLTLP
jgi:hypothetical protein